MSKNDFLNMEKEKRAFQQFMLQEEINSSEWRLRRPALVCLSADLQVLLLR